MPKQKWVCCMCTHGGSDPLAFDPSFVVVGFFRIDRRWPLRCPRDLSTVYSDPSYTWLRCRQCLKRMQNLTKRLMAEISRTCELLDFVVARHATESDEGGGLLCVTVSESSLGEAMLPPSASHRGSRERLVMIKLTVSCEVFSGPCEMSANFSNVVSAPVSFVSESQPILPWSTCSATWGVSPRSSAELSMDEPMNLHGTRLQERSGKDVRNCVARIVSVWPLTGKRNTHHGDRKNDDGAFQRSQTRPSPLIGNWDAPRVPGSFFTPVLR